MRQKALQSQSIAGTDDMEDQFDKTITFLDSMLGHFTKTALQVILRSPAVFYFALRPYLILFTEYLLSHRLPNPLIPHEEGGVAFKLISLHALHILTIAVDKREYDLSFLSLDEPLRSLYHREVLEVMAENISGSSGDEGGGGSSFNSANQPKRNRFQALLHQLVLHYCAMTENDVEEWAENPEDYFLAWLQETEAQKHELVAAIGQLLKAMSNVFPEFVVPIFLDVVRNAYSSSATNTNFPSISLAPFPSNLISGENGNQIHEWAPVLYRNAVSYLLGVVHCELHEYLPAEFYMEDVLPRASNLVQCISSLHEQQSEVRKASGGGQGGEWVRCVNVGLLMRCCVDLKSCLWVCGKWVGKIRGNRNLLYTVILSVIALEEVAVVMKKRTEFDGDSSFDEGSHEEKRESNSGDEFDKNDITYPILALRLQAAMTLELVLKDTWFEMQFFEEFSQTSIRLLFNLLSQCTLIESKQQVCECF